MKENTSQKQHPVKIMKILQHPNPKLRIVCDAVKKSEFDTDNLRSLIASLGMTLIDSNGVGIAAPQCGINRRIFLMKDLSTGVIQEYINPILTPRGDEQWAFKEGCLSLPGVYATIRRPKHVIISSYNADGVRQFHEYSDLYATCAQHEDDHLNGIEFVDLLSKFSFNRLKDKLKKKAKQNVKQIKMLNDIESKRHIIDD